MAPVIVKHAFTHRFVRGSLVLAVEGGVNAEAFGVCLFLVLVVHVLAHHFCDVKCVGIESLLPAMNLQLLL